MIRRMRVRAADLVDEFGFRMTRWGEWLIAFADRRLDPDGNRPLLPDVCGHYVSGEKFCTRPKGHEDTGHWG